ncbi:MAG: 4-hydroxy-tetrahydrodipicolinate reductase [Bacillota bacterium]
MRIALAGLGLTGSQAAEYILAQNDLSLVAAIVSAASAKIGRDIGEVLGHHPLGVSVTGCRDLAQVLQTQRPRVLIDFSHPSFIQEHIETLAGAGVHLVIATTGHQSRDIERIKYYTQKHHIGTVMTPNITYGVNVLMILCKLAARLMDGYDFEIIESHHRHKKDSPSGTAHRIADKILEGTAAPSDTLTDIPIHSIRAGGIVGNHKVLICGPHDKIELRHESFSRKVFAQGAVWAAKFIENHRGFYLMEDVFSETLLGYRAQTCAHCGTSLNKDDHYHIN